MNADKLAAGLAKAADIAGWRFMLRSDRTLTLGMEDSRFAGPYAPPSKSEETKGEYFVVWQDGKVSHGRIDGSTADRLNEALLVWRRSAYEDQYAAHILPAPERPAIPLFDKGVASLLANPEQALGGIKTMLTEAQGHGIRNVRARMSCTAGATVTASSTGAWIEHDDTRLAMLWEYDKSVSSRLSSRKASSLDGLLARVRETAELARALRSPVRCSPEGMDVLFHPLVVEQLIDRYILTNFRGDSIAEGRSRYSLDDFASRLPVMADDIDIVLDTAEPYGPGSYICTPELIPSGRVILVKAGRLGSALMDVKYSRKTGMPVTPLPNTSLYPGHAGLRVSCETAVVWKDFLESSGRVLLVCSVLGMHTQDPTTGGFSLAAPESLLIEDGEIKGKVKAVVAGNFFDALAESNTVFVKHENHPNPGICMKISITM